MTNTNAAGVVLGLAILLTSGLVTSGCAEEAEDLQRDPRALTITESTPTALTGTFGDGASTLTFQATEDADGLVALSIGMDDLVVTLSLDRLGAITVDSTGVAKTALQQDLLVAFHAAMIAAFPDYDEAGPPVERIAVKSLDWLEENAVGVPVANVDTRTFRSVVKMACEEHQHGLWNGSSWVAREVGQASTGGNGCWGRCGAGCSSNYAGVYSEDCGEHDHGLGPIGDCTDDAFSSSNCRGATSTIYFGYHAGMCNGASADHRHDGSGNGVIGGGTCY